MISLRNEFLRRLLNVVFALYALVIQLKKKHQRKNYLKSRELLKKKLNIDGAPVTDFERQRTRLESTFQMMTGPKFWAETSGTRDVPKKLPFDLKRTKSVQKTFLESMVLLTSSYKDKKTFFVFSSLDEDNSLTSGVLGREESPRLIELLQAPYRFLLTAQGKKLRNNIGDLTSRVAVLLVSRPRFLYATNPSTLTHFIQDYTRNWSNVRDQLEDLLKKEALLAPLLELQDGNARERLIKFAGQKTAPRLEELTTLQAFITWDGGYTGTFIEQLKMSCPDVDHIPMFSMSTEGIETTPHLVDGKISFLPNSENVLIEFQDPETEQIIRPMLLIEGHSYNLILSDIWGLRRYDTRDLFLVRGFVDGLPELFFKKRRGLTSSFTGEKITEEQALLLIEKIKTQFPVLSGSFMCLYPCKLEQNIRYELSVIGPIETSFDIAIVAEKILGEINEEYRSKVKSGRLLPLQVKFQTASDLADLMGKKDQWESQFKLIPLYEKLVART